MTIKSKGIDDNKDKIVRGDHSYDEGFKVLCKELFEEHYQVITDYELIFNSKRVDAVVILGEEPIDKKFDIFDYFKKYNIIEFKSEKDSFSTDRHLHKLLFYLAGLIDSEKEATFGNTTLTLISSVKPKKFLKIYESTTKKIKNGVYLIKGLFPIPLYLIIPREVDRKGELNRELALLKEFSGPKERKSYLQEILHKVINGDERFSSHLRFAFSLYRDEMAELARKEGLDMTLIEKNMLAWMEDFNLKERFINEGIELGEKRGERKGIIEGKMEDARKMLEKGLDIELIIEITGLPYETVSKLLDKV